MVPKAPRSRPGQSHVSARRCDLFARGLPSVLLLEVLCNPGFHHAMDEIVWWQGIGRELQRTCRCPPGRDFVFHPDKDRIAHGKDGAVLLEGEIGHQRPVLSYARHGIGDHLIRFRRRFGHHPADMGQRLPKGRLKPGYIGVDSGPGAFQYLHSVLLARTVTLLFSCVANWEGLSRKASLNWG